MIFSTCNHAKGIRVLDLYRSDVTTQYPHDRIVAMFGQHNNVGHGLSVVHHCCVNNNVTTGTAMVADL